MTAAELEARLTRARRLARLTDSAFRIPGTGTRVGSDALLGLVPVLGDLIGALMALYLPYTAWKLGAPRRLIGRMLANLALDAVLGVLPILGDLADIAWRANLRNLALLEAYAAPALDSARKPASAAAAAPVGPLRPLLIAGLVAAIAAALAFAWLRP